MVPLILFALQATSSPQPLPPANLLTGEYVLAMSEDEPSLATVVVGSYGDGISWASAYASREGHPFICPPDDLAVGYADYLALYRAWVQADDRYLKEPVGIGMFEAMRWAWPCDKK